MQKNFFLRDFGKFKSSKYLLSSILWLTYLHNPVSKFCDSNHGKEAFKYKIFKAVLDYKHKYIE